jgi:hypothetical protein
MLYDLPLAFIILAPCIAGFATMLLVSVLAAGRACGQSVMVDRIIVNLDPDELGTLGDTLLGNAERCIPGQPGFKPVGVKIKVVWRRSRVVLRSLLRQAQHLSVKPLGARDDQDQVTGVRARPQHLYGGA